MLGAAPTVSGRAVALVSAGACIIALSTSAGPSVNVTGSAAVSLPNCDVYANSTSSKALECREGAPRSPPRTPISSAIIRPVAARPSASRASLNWRDGDRRPLCYADRTDDRALRKHPNKPERRRLQWQLQFPGRPGSPHHNYPGVYCGNLTAGGPLTLSAGVYIVKGTFNVGGGSSSDPTLVSGACQSPTNKAYVNGTGVTIYLTGGNNPINVSSCLSLTAPTTGNTAGMAIWDADSGGTDPLPVDQIWPLPARFTRHRSKSSTLEARAPPAAAPKLWRELWSLMARQTFSTTAPE